MSRLFAGFLSKGQHNAFVSIAVMISKDSPILGIFLTVIRCKHIEVLRKETAVAPPFVQGGSHMIIVERFIVCKANGQVMYGKP